MADAMKMRELITPRALTNLYKGVARALHESGEVAGEGFIIRLAEITVDATLDALDDLSVSERVADHERTQETG